MMHKQYEQIKKCEIIGTRTATFIGFYLTDVEAKVCTRDLFGNN
jgi:hypothetical protein